MRNRGRCWICSLVVVCSLSLICVGCSDDPGADQQSDQSISDAGHDAETTSDVSGRDSGESEDATDVEGDDDPYQFESEEGFSISGGIDDGASVTLESDDQHFGTKITQYPSVYDLVDRGSWIQGQHRTPYDEPELGEEVPVGDDYVFSTRGGTPRFYGDDDPVGPDRTRWYGGQFTEDGPGNVTLRRPVEQFTVDDNTPEKPRVNYYLSWFWRSTFLPGEGEDTGSSAKFTRIWDTEGGTEDGYRVSWTRMHLTANSPGSDPYPSWAQVNPPVGEWAQFEFDSHTVDGGSIRAWVNGELLHDPTIPEVDENWNGNISINQWGYDPSVDISDPDHQFEISDLYADVSPARVVLADASTMDEASIRVPQMHLSWTEEEIELPDLYPGPLMTLDEAYVIVITEQRDEMLAGQIVASD